MTQKTQQTYYSPPTSAGNVESSQTYYAAPTSAGETMSSPYRKRQSYDVSNFATTIGGRVDECNGDIILSLQVPIEKNIEDDNKNYATWTRLRFKYEDSCDYPEGNKSGWDKEFESSVAGCSETFDSHLKISDLLGCTGTENVWCYDSDNVMLSSCNPDLCVSPPCHRCYPGQLLASRGYVRTSVSGELTSAAVAENCHNFKICLPWIQNVQADIKVTTIPNF